MVDHGVNGYLCAPKSCESLLEQMEKIINSSVEERRVMGENSRKKVEAEFDEKIVIEKYLDVIRSVC
ncbi:hypothetical protein D3C80_2155270 [compost metagenome]